MPSSRYRPTELPRKPPKGFDMRNCVLIYQAGDRKVYTVGEDYIIKKTRYGINSEVATHNFVSDNTSVPVPFVYAEWLSEDGKWHHILEGRIKGEPLTDCWRKLSMRDKINIAEQVAKYMARLSQFTSRKMQSISGQKLFHNVFVPKPVHGHLGIWDNDEDIFNYEFLPGLRRAGVSGDLIRRAYLTMPPSKGKFVFTHGDLYVGNVMVDPQRGRVTAIIDWESAGFWPHWFQYARITHGCNKDDGEWKYILSEIQRDRGDIPQAAHGRVWYEAVGRLMYIPDDPQAKAWLSLLARYLSSESVNLHKYKQVKPETSGASRWRDSDWACNGRGRGDEGYYGQAYSMLPRGFR
ncbi:hypothetical protein MFIFM68171_04822 [Madurella fahalii]|uniref:Aminoglycoside phosphotransferase domain-containing protein n=1 Tax=Madurella fahalii TaxID=1157608 RepID=A0ABQ0GA15_9PEZI